MCQADSPESPKLKEEIIVRNLPKDASGSVLAIGSPEPHAPPPPPPPQQSMEAPLLQQSKDVTPPSKRGRGRPRRATSDKSPTAVVLPAPSGTGKVDLGLQKGIDTSSSKTSAPDPKTSAPDLITTVPDSKISAPDSSPRSSNLGGTGGVVPQSGVGIAPSPQPTTPPVSVTLGAQPTPACPSIPMQSRGRGRKVQGGVQAPRRRGKKQELLSPAPVSLAVPDPNMSDQLHNISVNPSVIAASGTVSSAPTSQCLGNLPVSAAVEGISGAIHHLDSQSTSHISSISPTIQSSDPFPVPIQVKGQIRKTQNATGTPRRRGRKEVPVSPAVPDVSAGQLSKSNPISQNKSGDTLGSKAIVMSSCQKNGAQELRDVNQEQASIGTGEDRKATEHSDDGTQHRQPTSSSTMHDGATKSVGKINAYLKAIVTDAR